MFVFRIKKKTRFLIFAGAVMLVLVLGFGSSRLFAQKTPVALYVFDSCGGCNVQNPCKPCTVFMEQINIYSRILAENKLRNKTELKPYNIYMDNDRETYKTQMALFGIEEAPSLPAVVVGNKLIAGTVAGNSLVSAVKAERRFVPLLRQFTGLGEQTKVRTGIYDDKTVVDFSLPYCEDCKKTDLFLENIPGIKIVKIDPSDAAGRALYEKYCEIYGVPVNDYAVPRLFIQRSSFLGYREAESSLEKAIAGNFKTIKIILD